MDWWLPLINLCALLWCFASFCSQCLEKISRAGSAALGKLLSCISFNTNDASFHVLKRSDLDFSGSAPKQPPNEKVVGSFQPSLIIVLRLVYYKAKSNRSIVVPDKKMGDRAAAPPADPTHMFLNSGYHTEEIADVLIRQCPTAENLYLNLQGVGD